MMTFWIELNLNFAFFFMQVIHMLFWGGGKFDSIFTFSCMQVKIMMFFTFFCR